MLWSPSRKGFYHPQRHGPQHELRDVEVRPATKRHAAVIEKRPHLIRSSVIPADVIEIDDNRWRELLNAQAHGREIISGPDGRPIDVDPQNQPERSAPYAGPRDLFDMIYRDLKKAGIEGEFTKHIEEARAKLAALTSAPAPGIRKKQR